MGSQFPSPIRLAILETDTAVPGIQAKYSTYGGVFRHLFERAIAPRPLQTELAVSHHDVVNGDVVSAYPDMDRIDAILVTGSKYDAYDSEAWIVHLVDFTRRCLEGGRVRVIGVCFGHQIVGRALDAEVGRNPRGWEVSVVPLELTPEGKKLFGQDKLSIHQMHRDAILSFPAGVVPLARTETCEVQAMYKPKSLFSLQGHPEFTEEMVREILDLRKYAGAITGEMYNDGVDRVGNKHDGVGIARTVLRFLRE